MNSAYGLGPGQPRHKVFVSYHHEGDQYHRECFERLFIGIYDIAISKSVQIGDIDPSLSTETIRQKIRDQYLRDSTVTVVLVGRQTWQRKHVDWEIGSSIRQTKYSSRSGLLGILLPTHPNFGMAQYDPCTIPPRLHDNIKCDYAKLHGWSDNPYDVLRWIDEAFQRRESECPDDSYRSFVNNRSGSRWC